MEHSALYESYLVIESNDRALDAEKRDAQICNRSGGSRKVARVGGSFDNAIAGKPDPSLEI